MAGFNPVAMYGLELVTIPVDAAVGTGEPAGKINTSHCVAVPISVQEICAVVVVALLTITLEGFGHVGGGAQVTFAIHPGAFTEPSLRKRNVKHPLALEAVNGPGKLAPVKLPQ